MWPEGGVVWRRRCALNSTTNKNCGSHSYKWEKLLNWQTTAWLGIRGARGGVLQLEVHTRLLHLKAQEEHLKMLGGKKPHTRTWLRVCQGVNPKFLQNKWGFLHEFLNRVPHPARWTGQQTFLSGIVPPGKLCVIYFSCHFCFPQ